MCTVLRPTGGKMTRATGVKVFLSRYYFRATRWYRRWRRFRKVARIQPMPLQGRSLTTRAVPRGRGTRVNNRSPTKLYGANVPCCKPSPPNLGPFPPMGAVVLKPLRYSDKKAFVPPYRVVDIRKTILYQAQRLLSPVQPLVHVVVYCPRIPLLYQVFVAGWIREFTDSIVLCKPLVRTNRCEFRCDFSTGQTSCVAPFPHNSVFTREPATTKGWRPRNEPTKRWLFVPIVRPMTP